MSCPGLVTSWRFSLEMTSPERSPAAAAPEPETSESARLPTWVSGGGGGCGADGDAEHPWEAEPGRNRWSAMETTRSKGSRSPGEPAWPSAERSGNDLIES